MRRFALAAFALLAACSRTDGAPLDLAPVSGTRCAADVDCGKGRHCDDGVCTLGCVTSKDCAFALSDPDAENDLVCSPCGRCVASGVTDESCLRVLDRPCSSDGDCAHSLGAGYRCGGGGTCVPTCAGDEDCASAGKGFSCAEGGVCARRCFRPSDCHYFGWKWECQLPPGVDAASNATSTSPAYGECHPDDATPLFAAPTSPPAASAAYEGVWEMLAVSAVRTEGIPLLDHIDTFAINVLLAKARAEDGDVVITAKFCAVTLQNFQEDDTPPDDLFHIVYPDRNVASILEPTFRARAVPPLATGATFDTDPMIDVRGARLADPVNDPLPTRHDLTHQWDQDLDGNPGMTSNVQGGLMGEMYQAQRWLAVFHVAAADADHLAGLIGSTNDQKVLGASNPILVNDSVSITHPQPDRTYFRAERASDDTSCDDVIAKVADPSSWLAFAPHFDAKKRPLPRVGEFTGRREGAKGLEWLRASSLPVVGVRHANATGHPNATGTPSTPIPSPSRLPVNFRSYASPRE